MGQNQSTSGDSSEVDFDTVFKDELDHLDKRREATGRPRLVSPKGTKAPRTVDHDLRGLALSGGGIRSATFNLGLLQALGKHDGLNWCDYLSTVSGGGYIGSCLTSLLSDKSAGEREFPFLPDKNGGESAVVKHLRLHSSYLAPRHGLFRLDSWRLGSHYLMGLFFAFVVIATLLSLISLLGIFAVPNVYDWFASLIGWSPGVSDKVSADPSEPLGIFFKLAIGCGIGWLILFGVAWIDDPKVFTLKTRFFFSSVQGLLLEILVFCVGIGTILLIFEKLASFSLQNLLSVLRESPRWFFLLVVLVSIPLLAKLNPLGRLGARFARFTFFLLGVIAFLAFFLAVSHFIWLDRQNLHVAPIVGLLVILVILGVFTSLKSIAMFSFYRDRLSEAFIISWTKKEDPLQRMFHRIRVRLLGEPKFKPLLYPNETLLLSEANSSVAPLHLINATVNLLSIKNPGLRSRGSDFFLLSPLYCGSLSTGYRESNKFASDSLTLADAMAISGAAANPLYGPATNRALIFLLALLNARLGAWVQNPSFKLPTWACYKKPSICNQAPDGWFGYVKKPLNEARSDFLESLSSVARKLLLLFWPYYFVKELFGLGSERSHLVNLSDGGHIENLAVYELLRRRCKLIVASDVGADPDMKFEDLETLKDVAQKDEAHGGLGVKITLDLTRLQRDPKTKLSLCHVESGAIWYPNNGGGEEKGTIIYIKSSLTEEDPKDLREYKDKKQHSTFPHESTMNQFFDPEQFDSYRRLGYCVGKKVIERFGECLI